MARAPRPSPSIREEPILEVLSHEVSPGFVIVTFALPNGSAEALMARVGSDGRLQLEGPYDLGDSVRRSEIPHRLGRVHFLGEPADPSV